MAFLYQDHRSDGHDGNNKHDEQNPNRENPDYFLGIGEFGASLGQNREFKTVGSKIVPSGSPG